jgi:hypothetical protein
MRNLVPLRLLLVLGALGFFFWALPQPAASCEICEYKFFLGFKCRPVTEKEVGSTICTGTYSPVGGYTCEESGTFCTGITVDGGGGGGTGSGGGDGSSCQTSGFCPAACFSCGGGGGRPAV